jgi:hypothetical protein
VRARRADLRPDRFGDLGLGYPVLGAARHRRQQAGRVDQDPREDLRQHDPSLEALLAETRSKVAEYAKRMAPKIDPVEQAKAAGLVRLGVKKKTDDGEVIARV